MNRSHASRKPSGCETRAKRAIAETHAHLERDEHAVEEVLRGAAHGPATLVGLGRVDVADNDRARARRGRGLPGR